MATIKRARWEDIADNLLDLADEEVIKTGLPEVTKEDAVQLKIATTAFLGNIKGCYQKILRFNEFKKAEHKIREFEKGKGNLSTSKAMELREYVAKFKELKIQEQEFNFFMSQLEKYQKALNNYLGKEIQTLYLYKNDDGEVAVYQLIGDISKAVYQDIASRGGGMSARFSAKSIHDESVFQKMKQSTAQDNNLTGTYLETLRRGEKSREIIKSNGMLVLWKPAQVWKKMFVAGGAGDISEAYLSFLMSEERLNLFTGSDMEMNIDIFMLQGVGLVDNISGVLKGDFSANGIDYAAKAEGASVMGYKQIISLALRIELETPEKVAQIMATEYGKILRKEKSGSGRRNKLSEHLSTEEERLLAETLGLVPGVEIT